MWIWCYLLAWCCLCSLSQPLSTQLELEEMSVIGKEQGVNATSTFSQENLQKVLSGVEKGNRESISFYGLLKLYGLSVHKDPHGAAQQFQRASALGHKEATTAYGVMMLTGSAGETNYAEAIKYFRDGVAKGDVVSCSTRVTMTYRSNLLFLHLFYVIICNDM